MGTTRANFVFTPGCRWKFAPTERHSPNRSGRDSPEVVIDGRLGPATVASLRIYIMMRRKSAGEDVLLKALNALQGAYCIKSEAGKSQ